MTLPLYDVERFEAEMRTRDRRTSFSRERRLFAVESERFLRHLDRKLRLSREARFGPNDRLIGNDVKSTDMC